MHGFKDANMDYVIIVCNLKLFTKHKKCDTLGKIKQAFALRQILKDS